MTFHFNPTWNDCLNNNCNISYFLLDGDEPPDEPDDTEEPEEPDDPDDPPLKEDEPEELR